MTRPKSDRTPGIRRGATSAAFADTRLRLLARKGELQTQLQELECDQRRAGRPLSADFAEQACERENDEVIDALLIRARKELVDVGRALMRIDAGSYGRFAVSPSKPRDSRPFPTPVAAVPAPTWPEKHAQRLRIPKRRWWSGCYRLQGVLASSTTRSREAARLKRSPVRLDSISITTPCSFCMTAADCPLRMAAPVDAAV